MPNRERNESLDTDQKEEENPDELGVMKNKKGGDESYADFMEQGYHTGITTDAMRTEIKGYKYIKIVVEVASVDIPEDSSFDKVELDFNLPVPEELLEEGVIPENNMLADFLKEIGIWNDNKVLELGDLIGHKIKFLVEPNETENGTYMNIVRKTDNEFNIKGI